MHATAPLESAIRKDAALECCEAGFTHHDATSSSAGLIAVQPTTSDLQYTKPGVHAPAIVLALVGKRIVSDGAVDHCDDEGSCGAPCHAEARTAVARPVVAYYRADKRQLARYRVKAASMAQQSDILEDLAAFECHRSPAIDVDGSSRTAAQRRRVPVELATGEGHRTACDEPSPAKRTRDVVVECAFLHAHDARVNLEGCTMLTTGPTAR